MIKNRGGKAAGGRNNNNKREQRRSWKVRQNEHGCTSFVPLPTGGSLIKQLTGPVQPGRSDAWIINNITLLNLIPGEINKPYKQKSPREKLGD